MELDALVRGLVHMPRIYVGSIPLIEEELLSLGWTNYLVFLLPSIIGNQERAGSSTAGNRAALTCQYLYQAMPMGGASAGVQYYWSFVLSMFSNIFMKGNDFFPR